ncbi:hypothetical protein GQ457_02G032060 [Hibiscus cannabinus]
MIVVACYSFPGKLNGSKTQSDVRSIYQTIDVDKRNSIRKNVRVLNRKMEKKTLLPIHGLGSGAAWRLFCDENSMELVACQIKETCNRFEVLRSIHVGLSCVQRNLEDMPSMSEFVLMLSSDVPLQQPKQPGFFTKRDLVEASADNQKPNWSNDIAITVCQRVRATLAEKVLVLYHSKL